MMRITTNKIQDNWNYFYILPFLLLTPIVVFPIWNDIAIYARGGQALLDSKILYVDYIDIKSPPIYYICALIRLVLGSHLYSTAVADFVIQSVTLTLLLRIMNKIFKDSCSSLVVSSMYAICYVIIGLKNRFNCETMSAPLLIGIVYLMSTREVYSLYRSIIVGILCGLVGAIKYTLFIVLPCTLIYIYLFDYKENSRRYIDCLIVLVSALFSFLLCHIQLLFNQQMLDGYTLIIQFLKEYSQFTSESDGRVTLLLKRVTAFFGDYYSPVLTLLGCYGFMYLLKRSVRESNNYVLGYTVISFLMIFGLFMSIIVEGKFNAMHFPRLFPLIIPLSGVGLVLVVKKINTLFPNSLYEKADSKSPRILSVRKIGMLILSICAITATMFSPIPRYIKQLTIAYYYFADYPKYLTQFNGETLLGYEGRKHVIDYIVSHRKAHEKVLLLCTGDADLYEVINEPVWSSFSQSQFIFAKGVHNQWKERFYQELQFTDYIIVSNRDRTPTVHGHNLSSYESLKNDITAQEYINEHFTIVSETDVVKIYKRYR